MAFVMYSLVIRASYQGSYYKILNSNACKMEIQTFDELMQSGFTFHIHSATMDLVVGTEVMRKG